MFPTSERSIFRLNRAKYRVYCFFAGLVEHVSASTVHIWVQPSKVSSLLCFCEPCRAYFCPSVPTQPENLLFDVYMYTYIYICYMCIRAYIYIYTHICMHTYIYIYVYVYIYIYSSTCFVYACAASQTTSNPRWYDPFHKHSIQVLNKHVHSPDQCEVSSYPDKW